MKKILGAFLLLLLALATILFLGPDSVLAKCDTEFCTPANCLDSRCNTCNFCLLCDLAFCTPADCLNTKCLGCDFCDPVRCDVAFCTPADCSNKRCSDCDFCTSPSGTFSCYWAGANAGCVPANVSCATGYEVDLNYCRGFSSSECNNAPATNCVFVRVKCSPPDNSWCCEWARIGGGCVPNKPTRTCCPTCEIPPEAWDYCDNFSMDNCDYAPPQSCTDVGGTCDDFGGTCTTLTRRGCGPDGESKGSLPPCKSGEICCVPSVGNGGNGGPDIVTCPSGGKGIVTAIGCIPLEDTNAFIKFLLRWGLGIGGGVAFLLIVLAGFQIITSSGDPKRLQAGKELLTSAIAGLLLIIFSVFILRLIGADILGIFQ